MDWKELPRVCWSRLKRCIDAPVIDAVIRHVSGTVVAVLCFWFAGWSVKHYVVDEVTRGRIDWIENIVLTALFIILGLQLVVVVLKALWKEMKDGWDDTHFLAF